MSSYFIGINLTATVRNDSAVRGHMYMILSSMRKGYCQYLKFYNACLEGEGSGFL